LIDAISLSTKPNQDLGSLTVDTIHSLNLTRLFFIVRLIDAQSIDPDLGADVPFKVLQAVM
jgi:hypothetical protein